MTDAERRPKVLFVDDDDRIRAGLRRRLRDHRSEWDMAFFCAAEEVLTELASRGGDLVVTDVNMPGIDGFELLARMRAEPSTQDIPVVILTGHGDSAMKRRALELGATDLLNKPIEQEDLLARVRNALRIKDYQDRLKRQNAVLDSRVKERTRELEKTRHQIVWRLAKAGEFRDEDTGNHVVRVGRYCHALAREAGLEPGHAELLALTSPLHDIGKIGVPDAVLRKPGKLDADEWRIMQRHSNIGADILIEPPGGLATLGARLSGDSTPASSGNPILWTASSIARHHHEKWNGAGYPDGLAGEAIPIEARITSIADVYDALRSKRPYKPAFSEERALTIMAEEAGKQFDPQIYAAFVRIADRFSEIHAELADD